MNIRLRGGYNSSLFPWNIGVRSDRPGPAKVAILIDGPSCATAFPDLHPPVIAVGRNCENKCNRRRHNHSAQISNEECAYQFVSLHFPYSISKLGFMPIVYLAAIIPTTNGHEWTQISPTLQLLSRTRLRCCQSKLRRRRIRSRILSGSLLKWMSACTMMPRGSME